MSAKRLVVAGLAVVVVCGIGVGIARATEATLHMRVQGSTTVPTSSTLTLEFNQDLLVRGARVRIVPDVPLETRWKKGRMGETILQLTPQKPLNSAQKYHISIQGLQRLISRRSVPEQIVRIQTELAPGITEFSPMEPFATRDISFQLTATDHVSATRRYELQLEPAAEVKATFDNELHWRWKPVQPLKQGTKYKVTLRADGKVLQVHDLQIAGQPNIVSATEKDHFYPSDTITVVFDRPMRTNQDQALFFNMPGNGRWENNKTYIFTPQDLGRDRSYTYNLKAGLASEEGGVLEVDRQFTIHTPGPALVTGASPYGSGVSRQAAVRVAFDQPVDHASAQAKFSITPAVGGSFRWEGNTMVFVPSGFDFQTTYTVSIAPGVVPTYGVPSVSAFRMQFTTEVQTVRLNVPAFAQTHKLSCEASALRMALAYRGVQTSDFALIQKMGYNPRPLTNGEWDDPYSQFVGEVEGKQWNYTGYGVYAPPVAKAAQAMGRNATVHYGVSAGFLAQQIHSGNPVVIWGYNYAPTPFSWKTAGGQTIAAWQGEHTRTVVGVVGKADAPQGFYVIDPSNGGTSYWSAGALMANMNVHGGLSNQAVAVY